jgi:hypothetical protein
LATAIDTLEASGQSSTPSVQQDLASDVAQLQNVVFEAQAGATNICNQAAVVASQVFQVQQLTTQAMQAAAAAAQ